MPRAQRIERWREMMGHLTMHDIHAWRRHFLEALTFAPDLPESRGKARNLA